jgi:hypothetical protein
MAKLFEPYKTHTVSSKWPEISLETRLLEIQTVLNSDPLYQKIQVTETSNNGHVTLRIEENIPANERGLFLITLEEKLKKLVDIGLTIWLEPVGDKSKLRNLRGVQIKA